MRLREVFRFELAYQARRPWPWLAFAILLGFSFQSTRVAVVPATLAQDFVLNSPFIVATVTVFSSLVWLLVASAMAGDAAARDVQTGMHPLVYTTPLTRAEYLGGRFLAAFCLNALVLLGVQLGCLLGVYAGGVDPAIVGPFRPGAYLAAYGYVALPNAFVVTALQFAAALRSGRGMAAYLVSAFLLFLTVPLSAFVYFRLGPTLGRMTDPIGMIGIMNDMMLEWTLVEKNVRMLTLEGPVLWNRLLWVAIALGTLALTYARFRFAHRTAGTLPDALRARVAWWRGRTAPSAGAARPATPISVPRVHRSFGFATTARQALAIAGSSFGMIARSPAGLFLLAVFPAFVLLVLLVELEHWGVPIEPRTGYLVSKHLAAPLTHASDYRVMIPLLVLYFAGELVWRERDAGMGEAVDATPVPEWALFLGKLLGLSLVLAAAMASLTVAGVLAQAIRGHHDFQAGLYVQLLFGLQLPEYLLFAVLALAIHVVVDHKYVGLLAALLAYLAIVFAPVLGVEHSLLVYGAGPEWTHTEMRGLGGSVGPWLWLKAYWAAWALLLAVAARLLWVRGREPGPGMRLRMARRRITRTTAGVAAAAAALVGGLGGFVFYNTNVLHDYVPRDERVARQAEYERRYGRYEGVPQPRRAAADLHVELHPDRGTAHIRGTYRLVNDGGAPIDSLHVAPALAVKTQIAFDRAARRVVADERLGHSIYSLDEPLRPGESVTMRFEVRIEPRGFRNGGAFRPVVANGSQVTSAALPALGYQPGRELVGAQERREHGLPRQVTFPAPDDVDPSIAADEGATFRAVVVTDADQVAVAPGELRRTWTEGGRRSFHYASDVPIRGQLLFLSADYAVHRERRNGVEIQVYLHPDHTRNLDRLLRSARASLDYYSAHFGPYPYRFLQFVEQPGNFMGMGVDGSGVVAGGEGFFLLDPEDGGIDVVSQVVAHEVAHQWWGVQLRPAPAEGAIVLSEGLAWYSALHVVEEMGGPDQLRRFRSFLRQPYPWPPIRTGLPLLRAMDPWAGYRKGPYALYALSEYVGEARVNGALASLLRNKAGAPATTADLYRELQAATPDSLRYLLHDLFETNTFWELETERATVAQTGTGAWEVTLDVRARKVVYDSAGVETEVAMDERVPIGVFGRPERGRDELSAPLHLEMHRIRSGRQTLTVTVPREPVLAGIDPHHLLDWVEQDDDDNVAQVEPRGGSRNF